MITCPSCNGSGKVIGLFPVYAPGTPEEKKRPYIESKCFTCHGVGEVDDGFTERLERGQKLKRRRLDAKLGMRECAERLKLSATFLSQVEMGRCTPEESEGVAKMLEGLFPPPPRSGCGRE